jgi:transcription elongation factor GreA
MSDRVPLTKKGFERIRDELKRLKTSERRDVANQLELARAHGDLKENADYDAARERQGMLEAMIRDLEDVLARAEVIDTSRLSGDRVVFGATVELFNTETDEDSTIRIVGQAEADVKSGCISVTSPMARALIGKHLDDTVRVNTPGGRKTYEITDVSFE